MSIRITDTVKALLISYVAMFVIQHGMDQFLGGNLLGTLGLVPARFINGFQFWQIVTYTFLHADTMHLVLNCLVLVFVASDIEYSWGRKRFLIYYFFCSSVAGIFYLLVQVFSLTGLYTPMVGASGGLYGLLVAYGLMFGERIVLFMMIFPMKAKNMVLILAGIEFISSVFSPHGGLSSVAHLGGMVGGAIFLFTKAHLAIQARKRQSGSGSGGWFTRGRKPRKNNSHLKVVIDNTRDFDQDRTEDPKTWH